MAAATINRYGSGYGITPGQLTRTQNVGQLFVLPLLLFGLLDTVSCIIVQRPPLSTNLKRGAEQGHSTDVLSR
jgi:hypothetical protein